MIDENVGAIPIKNEDKIIVELKVTDAQKAWDILGKLVMNKIDLNEYGLDLNKFYTCEESFKINIKNDIRKKISKKINDALNDINKMLGD